MFRLLGEILFRKPGSESEPDYLFLAWVALVFTFLFGIAIGHIIIRLHNWYKRRRLSRIIRHD